MKKNNAYEKIQKKCEAIFRRKFQINDDDIIYDSILSIILQYRKSCKDIKHFDKWLNGAIHNHYCMYLEKKNQSIFVYSDMIDEMSEQSSLLDTPLIDREFLLNEIDNFSSPAKEILEYRLLDGKSHKQIALIMDLKDEHVRKIYSRSIDDFREKLKNLSHFLLFLYVYTERG